MDVVMQIQPGDRILVGKTLITVSDDFVRDLEPGDMVVGVEQLGLMRRIPRKVHALVSTSVASSLRAFSDLARCSDGQLNSFFDAAATLLGTDSVFETIKMANNEDVEDARRRGRSTTRLELSQKMRLDMISAFEMWRDVSVQPFSCDDIVEHTGWTVEQWKSPLGVIGFVFEGRPNVFADATGVLRSGNTVVFRIGSDALRTAHSIMQTVIRPALEKASLPRDSVILLDSKEHAAGWSLFSDSRLALAVARGSGQAVSELGSIARQAGVPVSLHGTGGAWIISGEHAESDRLFRAVKYSLDRKVCNTANVVVVMESRAAIDVPIVAQAATEAAAARTTRPRIHCVGEVMKYLPAPEKIDVIRADGVVQEYEYTQALIDDVSRECEWEETPEFFLLIAKNLEHAIELFNFYSPQFVVSIISESREEHEQVWRGCNAPFVGDGFTRWVDGQFALNRPELGLSNWQFGRLFGRGGILSGDSAFTVRLRVRQEDVNLYR